MNARAAKGLALVLGLLLAIWMAWPRKAPHEPSPAGSPTPPVTTEMPRPGSTASKSLTGLVYEDVLEGTGPAPSRSDTVAVHYTTWLADGTRVFSSRSGAEPVRFTLHTGQAIAGFEEGVTGMKVGGRRNLWVPTGLGYGHPGAPGIPAGSALVFEVELVGVAQEEEGPYPADRGKAAGEAGDGGAR